MRFWSWKLNVGRWVGLGLSTVGVFCLLGCPQQQSQNSLPNSIPGYATAPTISPAQQTTPQTPAAPTETTAEHTQKVQALIAQVEASYTSGVNNYNANQLDAARQNFDYAVDLMLESGMDLKTDPVLSDEFESLLSRINSLEMLALKQGNGFSPKVEPTPLEEAMKEVTFPPNPALLGRLNAELKTTQSDLPLVVNNYVAGFISYFTNSPTGHAHLVASLERAGKYKAMIQRILNQYGVPQDLIYQAVAESGFQPQVVNARSGAGGMWQFMPFGNYGLERNGYFDERFDPEESTIAYAKYMKELYGQFGDWYLAMAAYDWGPANVQRVVSRTGYADFWQLYRMNVLPAETKNYVPGILAAVIMAKNPKQYGLTDLVPDPPVVFDTVTTNYAISLSLVADLTDSTVASIVALNPAMLRLSTPADIPYDLHLPAGTKQLYLQRIQQIPEDKRTSWRFHIVKEGETLEQIADALHARAEEVAQFNNVTASKPIEVGDELIIPVSPVNARANPLRYTPRHNDSLINIADRFGVTVDQLREWNHLHSNFVRAGHPIYVAQPVRLAPRMREHRRFGHRFSRTTHSSRSTHESTRSKRASRKKKKKR